MRGFTKNLRVTPLRETVAVNGSVGLFRTVPYSRPREIVCVVDSRRLLIGTDLVQYSRAAGFPTPPTRMPPPIEDSDGGPDTWGDEDMLNAAFCEPWAQFVTLAQHPNMEADMGVVDTEPWQGAARTTETSHRLEGLCDEAKELMTQPSWVQMTPYFSPIYRQWLQTIRRDCSRRA